MVGKADREKKISKGRRAGRKETERAEEEERREGKLSIAWWKEGGAGGRKGRKGASNQ